tara:strand:- start:120 stop:302 length:183 start_codon:yes stop_codon:yes gene_type:complete
VLLFNIAEDPHETKNLAASMSERAEALDKQLMAYLKSTGAYLPVAPTREQLTKKRQGKKD